MPLDADVMIDRRALRRKLTFWRVLAIVAAAVVVIALGLAYGGRGLMGQQGNHIARISLSGLITVDQQTIDLIRRVKNAGAVSAAIISINSPGGTTTGSESVYREIRDLAKAKPTVAVVVGTAASGAYIAALAADRIVSPETGIVGSIGVVLQYPNFVRALDMLGIKVESVRSAPLKAQPSGIEPTPPEATAAITATVLDTYQWFKDLVQERRKLSDAELARVVDGRVFTGRQGIPLKLVDQLGDEREAQAWLESEKKLAPGLRIVEYRKTSSLSRFGILAMAGAAASALGYDDVAAAIGAARGGAAAQSLDGLLSVWQPQAQN